MIGQKRFHASNGGFTSYYKFTFQKGFPILQSDINFILKKYLHYYNVAIIVEGH